MLARSLILVLAVVTGLLACNGDAKAPLGPAVGVLATVRFINIEGGCWALQASNISYQPLNLPAQFKQNGLQVRVEFTRRDDYASICMIGPIIQISSIQPS